MREACGSFKNHILYYFIILNDGLESKLLRAGGRNGLHRSVNQRPITIKPQSYELGRRFENNLPDP